MMVRQLTAQDATAYQDLRLRCLRENPVAFISSHSDEATRSPEEIAARVTAAADGSSCVFGAFAGQQLVGNLAFVRERREKLRHCAELCGMYVAPEFRRCGRGGALLDAALAHARSLSHLRQLKLTVAAVNEEARALYRSRGFTCVGVEPDAVCVDGHYYDDELHVLRLTNVV
jgi:GNAT superfamily N-acetyltransferase